MEFKNKFFSFLLVFLLVFSNVLFSYSILYAQNKSADKLIVAKNSLNFIVISDEGRDDTNKEKDKKIVGQALVAKQMAETAKDINASFIVTCGDNFHGKGVSSAIDSLWKINYENVYSAKSLMIPWYITLGNHDYEGNVDGELDYAKTSKTWKQPARYYSVTKKLADASEVLLIILDSSPFIQSYIKEENDGHHVKGQNSAKQLHWCDSVLSNSKAKWKLAFFHHPIYSASSKHGSTQEIQEAFLPIFEKYNVDVCFSGHDHDMQHSHVTNSKIEFFGVGTGSDTRPVSTSDFTKFSSATLGFGVVSLTSATMRFSFVDEKGIQVYNYEVHK